MFIVLIFLWDGWGWSSFVSSFKFIGLFHTVNGASFFDLNFRGFHRPVTAPRPHFKLLEFSLKIKYLGSLRATIRKNLIFNFHPEIDFADNSFIDFFW